MRSAAGAYDSGAGGDITKALPLAIDQNANQRHTAPADRAIDRSEYPAHQVITKRGLRTIFFQNADPHAAFADALPVEEYFAHQVVRSEEHTSELQSLMRISYAVFCLKKKKHNTK